MISTYPYLILVPLLLATPAVRQTLQTNEENKKGSSKLCAETAMKSYIDRNKPILESFLLNLENFKICSNTAIDGIECVFAC